MYGAWNELERRRTRAQLFPMVRSVDDNVTWHHAPPGAGRAPHLSTRLETGADGFNDECGHVLAPTEVCSFGIRIRMEWNEIGICRTCAQGLPTVQSGRPRCMAVVHLKVPVVCPWLRLPVMPIRVGCLRACACPWINWLGPMFT